MKKIVILTMLCIFGIQTAQKARAQCSQPWEFGLTPDYKVFRSYDPSTDFTYGTTASIRKTLIAPDGSLWIAGDFDKVIQYDSTSVVQSVQAKSLAQRDLNGTWHSISLPPGITVVRNIWFLEGTLYAAMDLNGGIRKYDTSTNSWSLLLSALPVVTILPTGNPSEYWLTCQGAYSISTGMYIWNIQTGVLTPMANSSLPDASSWYYLNENQTGDTVFVKFSDLTESHRVLIRGQSSVLDFQDIGMTDPRYGSPNVLNGATWAYSNTVRLVNGRVFANVSPGIGVFSALMEWNFQTGLWDSVIVKNVSFVDITDNLSWYDPVTNRLSCGMRYVIDLSTNEKYSFGSNFFEPRLRQGSKLYAIGGILEDLTAPNPPNTTIPNGIAQIYGAQNVSFVGSNAHKGDIAKMYENGALVDSIVIDDSNCANFTFTQFVEIGLHEYQFTLTDPHGNESNPTSITVTASWPTSVNDVDQDFATVSTAGKTITVTGNMTNVQLYSLTGQVIFSSKVNSQKFTQSFEYVPTGIYILKASNAEGKMITKKIAF